MTNQTYQVSREDVLAALSVLGDTPDAIAESLAVEGIRGYRHSDCGCPIAVYLLGFYDTAVVDSEDITVTRRKPRAAVKVDTPDPVADFVLDFDQRGRYPDLVEGEPDDEEYADAA